MTKAEEKIVARIRHCNERGALAGLGATPVDPSYEYHENRFIKRLADSGKILFCEYTPRLGAGWILREFLGVF